MNVTCRLKLSSLLLFFEPQTRIHAFANVNEVDFGDWLRCQKFLTVIGGYSKDQFEILAVGQRMLKRGTIVAEPTRISMNRNDFRAQDGAAVTFLANVMQVGGQAVAHINHRMQVSELMKLKSLAHARREGQVPAQDAAS